MNPLSKEEFANRAVCIIDNLLDTASKETESTEFDDNEGFTWTGYKHMVQDLMEIHITCRYKYRNGKNGVLRSKWHRNAWFYKDQDPTGCYTEIRNWWVQY